MNNSPLGNSPPQGLCKPSHLSCFLRPKHPEIMWREYKGYSDCGPHWLFRLEFHSEILPESGVMSQPLLELRRWGGADSRSKLEAVAPLALFSAPFYLTVRNLLPSRKVRTHAQKFSTLCSILRPTNKLMSHLTNRWTTIPCFYHLPGGQETGEQAGDSVLLSCL